MNKSFFLFLVSVSLFTGCRSIGPPKVANDRFDYSNALSDSWKNQMLLNIVKVRYLDLPFFLDVGQVVSGYSLETSVNIGGSFTSAGAAHENTGTIGSSGRYTDRPTITYMPLTGENFLEGMVTPIKPASVFALLQSGYAADFILELCLDSLNGLNNRSSSPASTRLPDPEFFEVISLIREIQNAGATGMKIEKPVGGQPATVFFFRKDNVSAEVKGIGAKVRNMLGIDADSLSFKLVYSPVAGGPGELGVGTRSLYQILTALSMGVKIPDSHRERQLVPPNNGYADSSSLLKVYSGPDKPKDSFVAVPYEGQWFWIANNDWSSKRTFASILFLFTLADTGGTDNLPTITIPAQ